MGTSIPLFGNSGNNLPLPSDPSQHGLSGTGRRRKDGTAGPAPYPQPGSGAGWLDASDQRPFLRGKCLWAEPHQVCYNRFNWYYLKGDDRVPSGVVKYLAPEARDTRAVGRLVQAILTWEEASE